MAMETGAPPLNLATAILFFNKPALTLRCLQSAVVALLKARNMDLKEDWCHRFILIDNGSTPMNRHLIESDARALLKAHDLPPQCLEFVTLTPNQGFSRGMNAGLAFGFECKIDFICALSNDIELDPHFYTQLQHCLKSEAAVNAARILCPTVYHLIDRQSLAYTHGHCDVDALELSHSKKEPPQTITFPYYYPGAVTIWTPAVFAALGGFDPGYFCYWEDVSLSFYATMKGVALVPAPQLRVHHLGRGTTGSRKSTAKYFAEGRHRFQETLKSCQRGP